MIVLVVFCIIASVASGSPPAICVEKCTCTKQDTIVDCSNLELESLYPASLWSEATFASVSLEKNNLVHLTPFPPSDIAHLSLAHNRIARIDYRAFRDIKNLITLDLSHNDLTSLNLEPPVFEGNYSTEAYEPLSLIELKLSSNALHTLHPDLFEHLPVIKRLYLNSNPFKVIDTATTMALSTLMHLEVLDLSSTMLKDLPELLFHTPQLLKVVNISRNFFDRVPSGLAVTHSLEELVMDENPIEAITGFPSIPTLRVLRINGMPNLKAIGARAFRPLSRLTEFYCTGNKQLSQIHETAFAAPPQAPEEGGVWAPLKTLRLESNGLTYLVSTLVSSWDSLEDLNLAMNPWVCDCDNQWMVDDLIPTMKLKNFTNWDDLMCSSPSEMQGTLLKDVKGSMRCLDLYGNQPEKDGKILIGALVLAVIVIPILMIIVVRYRRSSSTPFSYSRALYQKTESMETFT